MSNNHYEDALDMVAGEATVNESLPVDWMKLALTVVWNFPSHPGFHPKDRSDEMYDEDPVTAWRDGWIAAVDALHAAVRDVTPAGNAILAQQAEPVREWQGLTEEQILWIENNTRSRSYLVHARAIEAALKEKNK